jgi:anaerobic selenocysteine-containing dehydrogenase
VTEELRGFCRFCIALCGIRVTTDGDRVVSVKGDPQHPASRGYTCTKGRSLGRWHHHPDRILRPRRRDGSAVNASVWTDVSWVDALADATNTIRHSIAVHGPDSVGVYIGTAASLDGAGKWAAERFTTALGSRSRYSAMSIDTPCKPLVSLLMSGFAGLVPVIDDRRCTLSVFIGSNPVVSHGHLNGFPDPVVRLRKMSSAPRELWVLDTRVTESSRLATRSLMPRPGTDFAILAFLIRELLREGGCDRRYLADHVHADDLQVLGALVEEWTVDQASAVTGCAATDLADLLAAVRRHGRVSVQTGTGTTMSAVANITEWLVWALHIVTGSYDAPGGMWFHPGFLRQVHTDIQADPQVPTPRPGPRSRPDVRVWGDEYPCSVLADEVEAGNLRVLVVFGGNPMTAFPNTDRTRRALEALDALIVLDVIDNETTEVATHVLPTKGQLERADLPYYYDQFNLDASTQYSPAFVAPMGEARSMWRIAAQLAEGVGTSILPASLSTDSSDDDVLAVLAGRAAAPFDDIHRHGYVTSSPVFGWVHDRVLPGGRWRLAPAEFVEQLQRWAQLVPPQGLLVTSRRQLGRLNSQHPPPAGHSSDVPVAVVHPAVGERHGLAVGDPVAVSSPYGEMHTTVAFNPDVHPDSVSLPHGWFEANVSLLTSEHDVDDLTGMVVQTAVPVTLRLLRSPG